MAVFGTHSGRRTRSSMPLPLFRNCDMKGKVSKGEQAVFDIHDAVVERREEEIALLREAGRKAVEMGILIKVKLERAERGCENAWASECLSAFGCREAGAGPQLVWCVLAWRVDGACSE